MDEEIARTRVLEDTDLLELLFTYLDPAAVKNAAGVSRLWRDVLHSDASKAWQWARLRVDLAVFPEQGLELLSSSKLAVVAEIWINRGTKYVVESLLRAVSEGTTRHLKILRVFLPETLQDSIDATLLSRAAVKVEDFTITGFQTSQIQLQSILTAVVETPDLALKTLRLVPWLDDRFHGVSPDILGRAAVKLESLKFRYVTAAQFEEILTILAATGESKLRELDIFLQPVFPDLSHMKPEIVTQAMTKLKTTGDLLDRATFSDEQITHLITKIKNTEDLELTSVDLGDRNVSQIPPAVLAGAVSRLEKVVLSFTDVTPVQIEAILTMLVSHQLGGSKLKELKIGFPDLSDLSSELLVGAIRRLEKIEFCLTTFTAEQVTAIFTMLTEGRQGNLKSISIDRPDVQGTVCPELLQAARQVGDLLRFWEEEEDSEEDGEEDLEEDLEDSFSE